MTQFYWERYSDDRLLKIRLKDLGVTIEGTWLQACVAQLYEELEARAILLKPHVWLSDEWFSPGGVPGLLAGLLHRAARTKAGAVTAADLMTSPAVTIGPDDTVEHAAKLMYDRKVKRLPVVDQGGRLVGIISRTDILAVFDRTDAEIREEIMTQVIAGHSESSWYSVIVKDGVVTLEGTPETIAIGHDQVPRTRHVQGVVAVRDHLVYPVAPVLSSPGPYF